MFAFLLLFSSMVESRVGEGVGGWCGKTIGRRRRIRWFLRPPLISTRTMVLEEVIIIKRRERLGLGFPSLRHNPMWHAFTILQRRHRHITKKKQPPPGVRLFPSPPPGLRAWLAFLLSRLCAISRGLGRGLFWVNALARTPINSNVLNPPPNRTLLFPKPASRGGRHVYLTPQPQ